jgi:hypothetical protein
MVVAALCNTGMKDFIKSFREVQQVLIIRRGENKVGCFLDLAVYAEGGRHGLIILLEGRDERGWARFAGELSKVVVVAFLEAMAAPSLSSSSSVFPESGKKFGSKFPSYAATLQARLLQLCLLVH